MVDLQLAKSLPWGQDLGMTTPSLGPGKQEYNSTQVKQGVAVALGLSIILWVIWILASLDGSLGFPLFPILATVGFIIGMSRLRKTQARERGDH